MNCFKISFLLLLSLIINFQIFADEFDNSESEEIVIIPEIGSDLPPGGTGRPKAPSFQRIDCHYSNGILYLQFRVPEGNSELTIVNNANGETQLFEFDTATPSYFYIGEMQSFDLFIETEAGKSYYGNRN